MSDAMTLRNINEMKRLMANVRGDIQTTGKRAKGMQEFVESIGVYTNVNPLTSTKHLEQTNKVVAGITEAFDAGYKGQGIGGHRAVYREISQKYTMGYVTRMGDDLKDELRGILAKNMDKGLGWEETAKDMVNNVDGMTEKRAITIARTESVRAKNLGQWAEHKEMGYKYFEVLPHSTACKKCKKAYIGVVFPMTGKFTVMLPPLHPRCRCAARFYKEVPAGYKVVRQVPEEYLPQPSKKSKPQPKTKSEPSKETPKQKTPPEPTLTDQQLNELFPGRYSKREKVMALREWNGYPPEVMQAAKDNDLWVLGDLRYYSFWDRTAKTEIRWYRNAESQEMRRNNAKLTDLLKEYKKTDITLRKSTRYINIKNNPSARGTLGNAQYPISRVDLYTNHSCLFNQGGPGAKLDKSWKVTLEHEMGHCFDHTLFNETVPSHLRPIYLLDHKFFSSLFRDDYYIKAVKDDIKYLQKNFKNETIDLTWGNYSFPHQLKPTPRNGSPTDLSDQRSLNIFKKYATSGYASHSMSSSYFTENFADSVSLMINQPMKFKKYFPNQFKFLKNQLKQHKNMDPVQGDYDYGIL